MASEGDIRAGRAFVELFVKTDPAKNKAAVAEAISTSTESAGSTAVAVGAKVETAMSNVGTGIASALRGVKSAISSTAEGMNHVAASMDAVKASVERLGPSFAQTGAAIATMAGNAVTIGKNLGMSFGKIGEAAKSAGTAVGGMATSAASGVGSAMGGIGAALKSVGAVLIQIVTKIPIVVAGLAALAAVAGAAYVAFQVFEPAIKLVWGGLKTLASIALMPIKAFMAMGRAVVSSVVFMATAVPRLIGAMASAVRTTLAFMWTSMVAGTKATMAFMWRAVTNPGKTLVQPLVNAFAWATDKVSGLLKSVGESITNVGSKTRTIGIYIAGSAAAIVGPLTAAAKKFADFGNEIHKGAAKAGMGVVEFSELSYAAKRFGISLEDLQKLNVGETADQIKAVVEEGRQLGVVLTAGQVAGAAGLHVELEKLRTAAVGFAVQLGSIVAPMVQEWTEKSVAAVKIAINWVKQNKELIATVFKIASIVATAGSVIAAIGATIMGVGSVIGGLGTVVATVGGFIVAMGSALAAVLGPTALVVAALSVGGVALVAWLNPLQWIRAGIQALQGPFEQMKTSALGAVATVTRVFGELRDWVGRVMGGINDAIMGGSPEKAFAVAMAAAKVAFVRGMIELQNITGRFGGIFSALASGDVASAIEQIKIHFKIAFRSAMDYFIPMWTSLQDTVDEFITYLQKAWNTGTEKVGITIEKVLSSAWENVTDLMKRGMHAYIGLLLKAAAIAARFEMTGMATKAVAKNQAENDAEIAAMDARADRPTGPTAFSKNFDLQQAMEKRKAERAAKSGEQAKSNTQELQALIEARNALAKTGAAQSDARLAALKKELDSAIAVAAASRNREVGVLPIFNKEDEEKDKKKPRKQLASGLAPTFSAAAAIAAGFGGASEGRDAILKAQLTEIKEARRLHREVLRIAEKGLVEQERANRGREVA